MTRNKRTRLTNKLWLSFKEFIKEDGIDKASILAYYSIVSSLFLLTFATFLFTRFLGSSDFNLRSMYPFTPDFFSKISPGIFVKAEEISLMLRDIGIIGIIFFLFLGFLIIKKVVQYINEMFCLHIKYKGFLVRRFSEFGLVLVFIILSVVNLLGFGFIRTITYLFYENKFLADHINPVFIEFLNTFLIKYVGPFLITFMVFLFLYKWVPEKKIYFKGAVISAVISTIAWEVIKRIYTYYLINISLMGKIKGPVIAIILFGFWMEISMSIMLYGAKLTYIFDREQNEIINKIG